MKIMLNQLLAEINEKKALLDTKRPLPQDTLLRIKKIFDVDLTYNSNAIEGSTMTFNETKIVLNEGITIGGKKLHEHLEVINHKHAIDYIEELSHSKTITIQDIKNIHNLVLRGIDDNYAGRFRDKQVGVRQSDGGIYHFVDPLFIQEKMEVFIDVVNADFQHPIFKAATAHFDFVTIHPFIDGNGRTARLLMNLILLQNGFPPAIIRIANRAQYLLALEKAQGLGGLEDFYKVIALAVLDSLNSYLLMIDEIII